MPLIVFLSGGTSGIGKLALKKLFDLGHTVIITGRTQAGLDEAEQFIVASNSHDQDRVYTVILDLSDLKSIERAVETVKSYVPYVDVIVHNAAGKTPQFEQRVNHKVDGIHFNNAIAPLYLNSLLMPLFEKSTSPDKRIMFVTSSLHDPAFTSGGGRGYVPNDVKVPDDFVGDAATWNSTATYSLSKLGSVWNAFGLADQYPQIPIFTYCPGFVPTTNLNRTENEEFHWHLHNVVTKQIPVTSEDESASEYVYYVTSPDLNRLSGKFFQHMEVQPSSKDSLNKAKRDLYFEYANDLIKEELERVQ